MSDKKKVHITFAPGAFDNFDGTQAELDALVAEVQRLAESGELEEMSVPLDGDWDELSEEDRELINQALENMASTQRKTLQ